MGFKNEYNVMLNPQVVYWWIPSIEWTIKEYRMLKEGNTGGVWTITEWKILNFCLNIDFEL